MNHCAALDRPTLALVEIIDFKWLMAREGHRVHVERLQADAGYARECVALGACSTSEALRDAAQRVALTLPPGGPPVDGETPLLAPGQVGA